MSMVAVCVVCGNPLPPERSGQRLYCSIACKHEGRNAKKRATRLFDYIKRHYKDMGEAEMRRRLATDRDFADDVLSITETYLPDPVGQEITGLEIDPELVRELASPGRRFKIMSHDTPLPSSADIDAAEASGDWSGMIASALKTMAWQFASGFKPDLRELDSDDNYGHPTPICRGNVRSEDAA